MQPPNNKDTMYYYKHTHALLKTKHGECMMANKVGIYPIKDIIIRQEHLITDDFRSYNNNI